MVNQPQPQRDRHGDRRAIDSDEKQYDEQIINIDRVARVVKGGRRFHFRALVAVGDHAGNIGIGVSKGSDVTSAVSKSVGVAKKNMVKVNLFNETIPHESQARVGGSNILIMPAAPGTGLKAGGAVRIVLDVAGVRNILSKSLGSSNKINAAYATLTALKMIEPKKNWVTKRKVQSNPEIEKPVTLPKPESTPKAKVVKDLKPAKPTTSRKKKA